MPDPFANHDDKFDAAASIPEPHSDAFNLPDSLQQILRWVTRQRQVSLAEIAQHFEQEEATIQPLLMALVERGMVQLEKMDGHEIYRPKSATRRGRSVPGQIWEKLEG